MATSTADQCIAAAGLTVPTGGVTASYTYGQLLPAASTAADLAVRATLRTAGMLRSVTAVTTAGEFATEATSHANAGANREARETGTSVVKPVLGLPGAPPVVANY